ncbi:hypothetical protein Scep_002012 [Stephania cephalantha]|uniref:Uncharacterized protein n=1 Tax=Stephania cephalantha TaxID=152367 RepID=A0AAP0L9B4_9MAGN
MGTFGLRQCWIEKSICAFLNAFIDSFGSTFTNNIRLHKNWRYASACDEWFRSS